MDKAGKNYWDTSWREERLPAAIDPYNQNLANYPNRQRHEYFSKILENYNRGELIEIGCARSVLLPYFAKEFGFDVCGLDYSEIGCHQAEQILKRENVKSSVVCSDFNSPPEDLLNRFDVLISYGVVEHFVDTQQCLKAFAKFLKNGGLMITIVPNLNSIYGLMQKALNKPIYDIHVALDIDDLNTAHQAAGLSVVDSRYFLSNDFSIVSLNGIPKTNWLFKPKKYFLRSLDVLSMILWSLETYSYSFTTCKALSPYIICTAKKHI